MFSSSGWTDPQNLNVCCSVLWLPAMTSLLFAVSIDTLLGLVPPQRSSPMGCAPKISSTERVGRDSCPVASETWAPILAPPLEALKSSGVVVSPTCAPAVPVVLLSLSSDLGSSPFFPFLSPFLFWRWWVEFLLGYYVDIYLAIALIVGGYAVISPWE